MYRFDGPPDFRNVEAEGFAAARFPFEEVAFAWEYEVRAPGSGCLAPYSSNRLLSGGDASVWISAPVAAMPWKR